METHPLPACVICGRPPHGDWTACLHCVNRIDDDLADLPVLTLAAAAHITPGTGQAGAGARGKPGSRPPVDLDAVDAASAIHTLPLIEAWEACARDTLGYTELRLAIIARARKPGSRLHHTVAFLRAQLPRLACAEGFPLPDLAAEIRDARRRLAPFDPDQPPPTWRVPCPSPHPDADGRACGYRLHLDRDDLRAALTCPRCGSPWTADRLLLVALADPGVVVWATLADCEAVTGVPGRTLQRWAQGGSLARRGTLYDVGGALRRLRADVS